MTVTAMMMREINSGFNGSSRVVSHQIPSLSSGCTWSPTASTRNHHEHVCPEKERLGCAPWMSHSPTGKPGICYRLSAYFILHMFHYRFSSCFEEPGHGSVSQSRRVNMQVEHRPISCSFCPSWRHLNSPSTPVSWGPQLIFSQKAQRNTVFQ